MYDTRTQGRTDVKVEIVMLINFQSKGFTKRKKRSHQGLGEFESISFYS